MRRIVPGLSFAGGASRLLDARAHHLRLHALAGAGAFGVLCAVAIRTRIGHRAGNAALEGRDHQPDALVEGSEEVLDTISVASLAVAGGAICAIGMARGGWRLGIGAGWVILGANVTTQVLKKRLLVRPVYLDQGDWQGARNSLPSGHATVATSLATALALVLPPELRGWTTIATGAYAATVGGATIAAGWHRPGDVMAASLVSGCWGATVAAILIDTRDRSSVESESARAIRQRQLGRGLAGASALMLASSVGVLLGRVLHHRWADLKSAQFDAAFWAGVLSGMASTATVLASLVGELSRIDLAHLAAETVSLPGRS